MRIKAEKTNSTSENAIRSSYFVIQSRKMMHLSRSTLSIKRRTLLHDYMCFFTVDVSIKKIKILTNHTSDLTCWAILNNPTEKYVYFQCRRLKVNRMLATFQFLKGRINY